MDKVRFDCWKDGKRRALTMSYDDGVFQDRRLVEIFNKYGIKGTFHLNSANMQGGGDGIFVSPDEVATLYAGHEVAVHTLTHPNLTGEADETVVYLYASKSKIQLNPIAMPDARSIGISFFILEEKTFCFVKSRYKPIKRAAKTAR